MYNDFIVTYDLYLVIFCHYLLLQGKMRDKTKGSEGGNRDSEDIPPMDFRGPAEKKTTFELAFSALKCKF